MKPKLLVVDDEPQVLQAVEDQLEDLFAVHVASNAEAALALLEEMNDVSVLLSDQRMPGMTGDELLAAAAEISDATRVVITGYADLPAVIRAVNRGKIFSYVAKPWDAGALRLTLLKAEEHHRLSRELREERSRLRQLNDDLERRVAERTAELETANRELEAFSYSVSHDLRAPLRHMQGFGRLLLEDCAGALDAEGRRHLDRLLGAADTMNQLIDDLLRLSQIAQVELRRREVDLSLLAHAVLDGLKAAQPARRVELAVAPRLTASADPGLLRIAMDNLLDNAWKYTGSRSPAVISVGVTATNGSAAYFVRDNGAGFDMRYADKLFRPFQRLHAATEFEGTGIGLATVQRIVRRHGGRVWAEATPGEGATVYFTLHAQETTK